MESKFATKILNKARWLSYCMRIKVIEMIEPLLPEIGGKIYDCFLFNNELDLLELRLREVHEHVDVIVIAECAKNFGGDEKPLWYQLNRDRFSRFHTKIRHVIIPEPPPEAYVPNPNNPDKLISEFWQRNQIAKGFADAVDRDILLISDVDEIPRPEAVARAGKIAKWAGCQVYFRMNWFLLFLNARVTGCDHFVFGSRNARNDLYRNCWLGTFACTAGILRDKYKWDLNHVWGMKWGDAHLAEPVVEDAGWHFSYMGGVAGLLAKIKANGISEYTDGNVQEIRDGRFANCALRIEPVDKSYPKELQERPDAWGHLLSGKTSFPALAAQLEEYLSSSENMSG
jgi:beta-1,4-mannosyl-glycoprotein beta-1,4-N-acetylglucosaminyltransferase